ncbi:hypothetical protein FJT64_013179 [Amphibalanus amphitrite]|uniref:F-box/LRR-repeat protein 6 n=1 Tax=Amphibalanus amphitrite TaxID=1232801 RepID=A0A6A4VA97_AMPAM|nr:hypothetical protein FJT64_013179 [Amphibalanus amphitrite]
MFIFTFYMRLLSAGAKYRCPATRLCQCWLCQCLTLWCQWCSGELAAALSDCSPLTQLCPTGPEVAEPRWPGRNLWDRLSVSLQGVTADTISHLADLGRTVTQLEIYDCPDLTVGSLKPLTRCRELQRLSVTPADLPLLRGQLPEGLWCLNVRGPEVTEPRWPEWNPLVRGLSVSLQGVAADTISHLADLGRTGTVLEIYDCTDLTTVSLEPVTRCRELRRLTLSGGVPDTVSLEPLTRCRWLEHLTLSGGVPNTVSLEPLTRCRELWVLTLSGGVPDSVSLEPLTRCPKLRDLTLSGGGPDTVLDSLSGCPRLEYLTLGDLQRPAETAFTAAAVTRLVKSCRKLDRLYLHCTADTGRTVLTALKEADLGRRSYVWPRTIRLYVPGELCRQLKSQEGRWVKVLEW